VDHLPVEGWQFQMVIGAFWRYMEGMLITPFSSGIRGLVTGGLLCLAGWSVTIREQFTPPYLLLL
jgi:hypothetical protein